MADVKTDAEKEGGKLDQILAHLDSSAKRMDAFEKRMDAMGESVMDSAKRADAACAKLDADDKARKDADEKEKEEEAKKDAEEKVKADAAKKDADDKAKEEEAKKDAARHDAAGGDLATLRADIAALRALVPASITPEQKLKMVEHQSRWNRVAQAFCDTDGADPFVNGESELDYRIRLAGKYQAHAKNPKVKGVALTAIKDSATLGIIEDAIYADALAEAKNPTTFKPGVLFPVKTTDAAGRVSTKYRGDDGACWAQFNPPVRHIRRILTPGSARVQ
jgi:hypothetical protein